MKRYRKYGGLDYIMLTCGVILLLVILFFTIGCTPSTKVRDSRVLWHDGECLLYVDGVTIEQAKDLEESWQFRNCEVLIQDKE